MIRLRAIKGAMGNSYYYLTTATFGEVARIVNYKDNPRDWPIELRQQRPLNMSRVRNDMVPYLVENEDHFYNALVVEHIRPGTPDHSINFVPDEADDSVGWVELEGTELLEALDGQHRLKSIELAVAENPDLASEVIGLLIVPHKAVKLSQQRFSDLNRNAKPTPKSLNIMFEHREEAALLAKELAKNSEYFSSRVNLGGSSLSERSPYIITISTLYETVKIITPTVEGIEMEEKAALLAHYWDVTLAALPGMRDVVAGTLTPGELRARYVYPTGIGYEALADTIAVATQAFPSKWEEIMTEGLPRIKWDLADPQWEGVALFAGRIAIARAARRRTATLVKHLLGLPNDPSHIEDLEGAYAMTGKKLASPLLVPAAI